MIKFTGEISFKKTPNGWVVCQVIAYEYYLFKKRYGRRIGDTLTIYSGFKFKPRCGFSLRPDQIIDWGK